MSTEDKLLEAYKRLEAAKQAYDGIGMHMGNTPDERARLRLALLKAGAAYDAACVDVAQLEREIRPGNF